MMMSKSPTRGKYGSSLVASIHTHTNHIFVIRFVEINKQFVKRIWNGWLEANVCICPVCFRISWNRENGNLEIELNWIVPNTKWALSSEQYVLGSYGMTWQCVHRQPRWLNKKKKKIPSVAVPKKFLSIVASASSRHRSQCRRCCCEASRMGYNTRTEHFTCTTHKIRNKRI